MEPVLLNTLDQDLAEKHKPSTPTRRGVTFLDLRYGQCHFPLGRPTEPPRLFCGAPTQPGFVYCQECRKIAYRAAAMR